MVRDHLDLGGWYDTASDDVKASIEAEKTALKLSKDPCRVLPLEFAGVWGHWGAEIEVAKKRFLEAKHPFYCASLGDAELALIGSGYPWKTEEINGKLRACGMSRFALGFRREFLDALRDAELLGLHQRWAPITEATALILSLSGIPMPPPNAVEVHFPYKMIADRSLFEYLAGRKVVLVGDKVVKVKALLENPAYCEAHAFLGPIEKMTVTDVFVTRPKAGSIEHSAVCGSWLDLDAATNWLKTADYDVALLGCGAMANILGHRVWKFGRSTLDVGFLFEALLGNSQRNHRPFLRDVKWIEGGL